MHRWSECVERSVEVIEQMFFKRIFFIAFHRHQNHPRAHSRFLISRSKWKCSLIGIISRWTVSRRFIWAKVLSLPNLQWPFPVAHQCNHSLLFPLCVARHGGKTSFLQLFRSAAFTAGRKEVHLRSIINAIKNPSNLNKLTLGHCQWKL